MILDSLENATTYEALGPDFAAAFQWLRANGSTAAGEPVEIGADGVIARPGEYETHPRVPEKFECHRRYVDIQFVAEGEETVEVSAPEALRPVAPHDEAKDIAWFASETPCPAISLRAGSFLVLWPHEAHQPGIASASGPCRVRKVVVKVPFSRH